MRLGDSDVIQAGVVFDRHCELLENRWIDDERIELNHEVRVGFAEVTEMGIWQGHAWNQGIIVKFGESKPPALVSL